MKAAAVALGALLTACAQSPTDKPTGTATIEQLETRIATLEDSLRTVITNVDGLETVQEMSRDRYATAILDPADGSFQRVDAPIGFGSFAVSIEDVRPYGDGVRITLTLGNPLNAGFGDTTVKLQYGPRMPDFETPEFGKAYAKWQGSLKSMEEKVLARLHAGSWNRVPITLPGVKPDQFGYLSVGIVTGPIYLSN